MTVRIAKILGLKKILELSKQLNIYEEIPELLSVSLGAAETTLINLTAAYAPFVNGGKRLNRLLSPEFKIGEVKQFFRWRTENV